MALILIDQFGFAPERLPPPMHLIPLTRIPLTFPGLSLRFRRGRVKGMIVRGMKCDNAIGTVSELLDSSRAA